MLRYLLCCSLRNRRAAVFLAFPPVLRYNTPINTRIAPASQRAFLLPFERGPPMHTKRDCDTYKRVSTHDFKTHISRYVRDLTDYVRKGYIIERYGREVALVMSLVRVEMERERAENVRQLDAHIAFRKRVAEQKRCIRARLLSWPGGARHGVLRGQSPDFPRACGPTFYAPKNVDQPGQH